MSAEQPKPLVASVVRSDGRLAAGSGWTVPNYLLLESCPAVLARAAERCASLFRPLGERAIPRPTPAGGARLISSFLDREPAGGWLSVGEAGTLLATHGIPVDTLHRCAELERSCRGGRHSAPVAMKADLALPADAGDIDALLVGLGQSAVREGWQAAPNIRGRAYRLLWHTPRGGKTLSFSRRK